MSSPNNPRRTKIVATVGPATLQPDILRQLIKAGATTLRINFSHGTQQDHQKAIRLIRQTAFELDQPVGILQDLQGPKIRLGKFAEGNFSSTTVLLTGYNLKANPFGGDEFTCSSLPQHQQLKISGDW